jgi:hypothetical protein
MTDELALSPYARDVRTVWLPTMDSGSTRRRSG